MILLHVSIWSTEIGVWAKEILFRTDFLTTVYFTVQLSDWLFSQLHFTKTTLYLLTQLFQIYGIKLLL